MRSLLTEMDIRYLLDQQEKLDREIREKHKIPMFVWNNGMHNEHEIALRVEVAEFVNACYQSWKYWKTKKMDRQAIIYEAVDVIHFIMLEWNKSKVTDLEIIKTIEWLQDIEVVDSQEDVRETLNEMLRAEHGMPILTYLLAVLDFYDFDRKQIMEAYKNKNKINHKRLEAGY